MSSGKDTQGSNSLILITSTRSDEHKTKAMTSVTSMGGGYVYSYYALYLFVCQNSRSEDQEKNTGRNFLNDNYSSWKVYFSFMLFHLCILSKFSIINEDSCNGEKINESYRFQNSADKCSLTMHWEPCLFHSRYAPLCVVAGHVTAQQTLPLEGAVGLSAC